jgi:hypothetical protein
MDLIFELQIVVGAQASYLLPGHHSANLTIGQEVELSVSHLCGEEIQFKCSVNQVTRFG